MEKIHKVNDIHFTTNEMHLTVDGQKYSFDLEAISEKLFNASQIEREMFKVSTSGYGIHWKLLDEDLSIDGLLRTIRISEKQDTLEG